MIELWRFLQSRRPLLLYGVGLTAVSSFGQTFFISLFVPSFLEAFGLTPGSFGTLYATATLVGALLLPAMGRWIDRIPLPGYTIAVLGTLAFSALLVAASGSVWMLGLGLLGLRLSGQGLASHAGLTAMARYFSTERGKALSVVSLGFSLGEATLPMAVAGFLAVGGWRMGWVVVAGVVLGVALPLSLRFLRAADVDLDPLRSSAVPRPELAMKGGTSHPGPPQSGATGRRIPPAHSGADVEWTASRVLRDPHFWLLAPAALLPPFWATGLILYQTSLGSAKGWSLPLLASAFVGFALARIVASLAIGSGIDRFSARSLFPSAVLPMGMGVALLALVDERWGAFAYLALLGTTVGMSGTLKTALWAELYGIRHLGAIKSMEATLMVMSTAAAPLVVGWALEDPSRLSPLLWGCVASVAAGFLLAVLGRDGGGEDIGEGGGPEGDDPGGRRAGPLVSVRRDGKNGESRPLRPDPMGPLDFPDQEHR